eukprot:jgi/Mesvir1/11646/Mv00047-RA.1
MAIRDDERCAQAAYNAQVHGRSEVVCREGEIEGTFLLDDKRRRVIEVKEWDDWERGVRELVAYGRGYPKYLLELHLFKADTSTNVTPFFLRFIKYVCKSQNIAVTLDKDVLPARRETWWRRLACCVRSPDAD